MRLDLKTLVSVTVLNQAGLEVNYGKAKIITKQVAQGANIRRLENSVSRQVSLLETAAIVPQEVRERTSKAKQYGRKCGPLIIS